MHTGATAVLTAHVLLAASRSPTTATRRRAASTHSRFRVGSRGYRTPPRMGCRRQRQRLSRVRARTPAPTYSVATFLICIAQVAERHRATHPNSTLLAHLPPARRSAEQVDRGGRLSRWASKRTPRGRKINIFVKVVNGVQTLYTVTAQGVVEIITDPNILPRTLQCRCERWRSRHSPGGGSFHGGGSPGAVRRFGRARRHHPNLR